MTMKKGSYLGRLLARKDRLRVKLAQIEYEMVLAQEMEGVFDDSFLHQKMMDLQVEQAYLLDCLKPNRRCHHGKKPEVKNNNSRSAT
jgi:hypothetical protein